MRVIYADGHIYKAIQWTGKNADEIMKMVNAKPYDSSVDPCRISDEGHVCILDVFGEFTPIKRNSWILSDEGTGYYLIESPDVYDRMKLRELPDD